jgi:phage N-6-adenine-methyltransferase
MNATTLKTMFSSKTPEWGTPQEFFESLDKVFNFTLDPCATDLNHKCDKYFTEEDNGLSQDWQGHTVFVNPPYGRGLKDWVKKSYEESLKKGTTVVMLIPARTDTKYFHKYCMKEAKEIYFVKGRLSFEGDTGTSNSAPFPSIVVIFSNYSRCTFGHYPRTYTMEK